MTKAFFRSSSALWLLLSLSLILVSLFAVYVSASHTNPGGAGGSQSGESKELNVMLVPPEVFDYTSVYSMFTYEWEKRYGKAEEATFSVESSQSRYKNEMDGTITVYNIEYLDQYDKIYELWLVDMDTGYTLSLGIFTVDSDGYAVFSYHQDSYVNAYDAVVVTKESYPDEDPRPNGDVVLVGYFDTSSLTKSTVSTGGISKEEYNKYGEEADTVYE